MLFSPRSKLQSFEEEKAFNLRMLMMIFPIIYPLTRIVQLCIAPDVISPWWPFLILCTVPAILVALSYKFCQIIPYLEHIVFGVCIGIGIHCGYLAYLNEHVQFFDYILGAVLFVCITSLYNKSFIFFFYGFACVVAALSQADKSLNEMVIFGFEIASIGFLFLMSTLYRTKLIERYYEIYEREKYDKLKSLAYQQIYQKVGTHLPQGIIMYSRRFSILFVNDKAAGNMQFRDIIGKNFDLFDQIHGFDTKETAACLSKVFAMGEDIEAGERYFSPIKNHKGEVTEVICTIAI